MKPINFSSRRDYQHSLAAYLASEEVQAYTMAILSFFALAFFSIFAIRPTLISFFNLQKQIEDATNIEQQLDTKINSLLKAQEAYQIHQSEISLLDIALPSDPQFPELVKKVEAIVNDAEATMSSFRTNEFSLLRQKDKKEKQPEDITSVNFTATVLPTYSQAESIIERLMNIKRIILFTALGAKKNENESGKSTIETTLEGSAYYVSSEDGKNL
jgi:hypothetical protein